MDLIYVADEEGDVVVLQASPEFAIINELHHRPCFESSPILAEEKLFLVGRERVLAIEKNKKIGSNIRVVLWAGRSVMAIHARTV